MSTRVEQVRFGGSDVLVSVVQLPGSQQTGALDKVRDKAVDALEAAQDTIEAVARSTRETITRLKAAGTAPSSVEVELGLAFTVQGNVVVAGGGVEASIVVHLSYDTTGPDPAPPAAGAAGSGI